MTKVSIRLNSIESVRDFCNRASTLSCDVDLYSGRYVVDAKSIMGIFSLALSEPIACVINAEGAEAAKAFEVIKPYVC